MMILRYEQNELVYKIRHPMVNSTSPALFIYDTFKLRHLINQTGYRNLVIIIGIITVVASFLILACFIRIQYIKYTRPKLDSNKSNGINARSIQVNYFIYLNYIRPHLNFLTRTGFAWTPITIPFEKYDKASLS
ncbi:unnamed protein product [Brachionus calyciflorus]|uniref:Uncharacterized protein n=1 Tax=Brachionus calyciflorus TaxID=104777 RepID=A0A813U699_9BILA|nr:unnamed protein product [Brachionus calyciflorus]